MKGNALVTTLIIIGGMAYHLAWIVWSHQVGVINDFIQLALLIGSLALICSGWFMVYQYGKAKAKSNNDQEGLQMIRYLLTLLVVVQALIYTIIAYYYLL